ncbi:hypothetical protein E2C01_046738 [Portunus trituberculatus]|uniref:Uncharacterized protein n=1 Tax=Portunus trituberculatus TaxID=210409 RepID=A0A5B7G5M1_PORTR|nr:hypothetical protein [Portunus trituberculatus]
MEPSRQSTSGLMCWRRKDECSVSCRGGYDLYQLLPQPLIVEVAGVGQLHVTARLQRDASDGRLPPPRLHRQCATSSLLSIRHEFSLSVAFSIDTSTTTTTTSISFPCPSPSSYTLPETP